MKKFLVFLVLVLACSSLEAKVDRSYDSREGVYSLSKEKPATKIKSVRKIIREILGKRKRLDDDKYITPPLKLELDNTVPIPTFGFENLKNLA
tara:strand:+ start:2467 stop:2745 length:279 start_codon:yes stop_codon:yes gene_type:complete